MHNLDRIAFRKVALKLTIAYLSDRTESVAIKSDEGTPIVSESKSVTKDVPQDSMLRPLLFWLYIKKLPKVVTAFIRQFADNIAITVNAKETDRQN